jgi:hypothetical protein
VHFEAGRQVGARLGLRAVRVEPFGYPGPALPAKTSGIALPFQGAPCLPLYFRVSPGPSVPPSDIHLISLQQASVRLM